MFLITADDNGKNHHISESNNHAFTVRTCIIFVCKEDGNNNTVKAYKLNLKR